jgi:hypothetical protein
MTGESTSMIFDPRVVDRAPVSRCAPLDRHC